MQFRHCMNCRQSRGFKRNLGWGTFFAVAITFGFWLFAIPFYPSRCIRCGSDARYFGSDFRGSH